MRSWLRGLDSNQDNQLQRLACYQLHYPGTAYKSVADLRTDLLLPASVEEWRRASPFAASSAICYAAKVHLRGEMSERFKEHAWKACVGETQPWVRIPLSPPF